MDTRRSSVIFIFVMLMACILVGLFAVTNRSFPVVEAAIVVSPEEAFRMTIGGDCHAQLANGDTYLSEVDETCITGPGAGSAKVEKAVFEPITPETVSWCPPYTSNLWLSEGAMYVGMPTAMGGTVVSMDGDWVIGVQDGQLVAEDGKTFLVQFPGNVTVHSALVYDNDPAWEELGWTLNLVHLPTTGQNEWIDPVVLDLVTSQVFFSRWDDSPHIGLCVGE